MDKDKDQSLQALEQVLIVGFTAADLMGMEQMARMVTLQGKDTGIISGHVPCACKAKRYLFMVGDPNKPTVFIGIMCTNQVHDGEFKVTDSPLGHLPEGPALAGEREVRPEIGPLHWIYCGRCKKLGRVHGFDNTTRCPHCYFDGEEKEKG